MANNAHTTIERNGLDRYIPEKGWGYNVVSLNGVYEVCPYFDGKIPMNMDVIVCLDFVDVGNAITTIMNGKA